MVSFKWDENRAREIAREEGREEERRKALSSLTKIVLNLFRKKNSVDDIADTTNISTEEVRKILRDNGFAV